MQTLVIVRNIFGVKHQIILKLSIIVDFHHGWENEIKYRCDWTLSHDAISWYKICKVVDSQQILFETCIREESEIGTEGFPKARVNYRYGEIKYIIMVYINDLSEYMGDDI